MASCNRGGGGARWLVKDNVAVRQSTLAVDNGHLRINMTTRYPNGGIRTSQLDFAHAVKILATVNDDPPIPQNPPAAQRGLEPDGTVVVHLPDGSLKRIHPDRSIDIESPDGTTKHYPFCPKCLTVHENLPPSPPDGSPLDAWIKKRNTDLLTMIGNIVRDDRALQRFVTSEANLSEIQIFQSRIDTLFRLVAR